MGEITVDLRAPGMTALHRAGVAGLFMTVDALRARGVRPEGLEWWETTDSAVTLKWRGRARGFFTALGRAAFGIADDGMIDMAGIDRANATDAARWIAHEGMLSTFCQFGPWNSLGPERTLRADFDDDHCTIELKYRPIAPAQGRSYPHRDRGGALIGEAIDDSHSVALLQWHAPGMTVRHCRFTAETALDDPPERALALWFAPMGCFFRHLRSRRVGRKARFALLVPEITDLPTFARVRRAALELNVNDAVLTGAGHAALELLLMARVRARVEVPRVTVVVLGTVTWNEKQKSRTGHHEVALRGAELTKYDRLRRVLASRRAEARDGAEFVSQSTALELFTENLAAGRTLYAGFSEIINHREIRPWLAAERRGLAMMVSREQALLDAPEHDFVAACHEALRCCYARAERGPDAHNLSAREYERWRLTFGHARTLAMFRAALMEFWARGGGNAVLGGCWRSVIPMLTEGRWRLARDLTLLALASYMRHDAATPRTSEDTRAP